MAKKRFSNIDNEAINKAQLIRIENYARQVSKLYELAADEFGKIASTILNHDPEKLFSFSDYPQTNERVNQLLKATYSKIQTTIQKASAFEWDASNLKNDQLVKEIFKSTNLTKSHLNQYGNRNLEALKAFQNRKEDGRTLSDRVWNYTKQFKGEVELALDQGLGEGNSAAHLSQTIRRNLKEPEKLFRRVRNKRGDLVLSKNAEQFNPGQGVYRSSYKNAMRLTRTETNMAYRASDHERWQQLDFVVGIEVRLSNNPNHCQTCEALKGVYPKNFKFFGWHPQCRCHAISILKTDEEIDADDIRILQGKDPLSNSVNSVYDVPSNFKNWVNDNKDRIGRAKSTPYWIRDNFKDGKVDKGLKFETKVVQEDEIPKTGKINLKDFIKGNEVTNKEINSIFKAYAELHPENFRIGLEGVSVRKSSSYLMQHLAYSKRATNEWTGKSSISISSSTFNRINFNPADELKSALMAIKKGENLTFNQEYSIEALWHEILHAKTKTPPRRLTQGQLKSMETINQFVARHTYDEFLSDLGGNAVNKADIMERGYGYTSWINDFREKLSKYGISEKIALNELTKVLMSDYAKVEFEMLKFFSKYKK